MHDGRAGDEAHRPVVGEEVDALAVDEAAHRDYRLAEAPGEAAGDAIVAQGLEREGLVANAHGDAAPSLFDTRLERTARRLEDDRARQGRGDAKAVAPRPGIHPAIGGIRVFRGLGGDERSRRHREQAWRRRGDRRREADGVAPYEA